MRSVNTVESPETGTDAVPASDAANALSLQIRTALKMATDQELTAEWTRRGSGPAVTSVRWGLTVPLGNFSSARLDAEALVVTGSTAESTLQELKEWVAAQSPLSEHEANRLLDRRRQLVEEVAELFERSDRARRDWQKIEAWYKRLELPIPEKFVEDLPF